MATPRLSEQEYLDAVALVALHGSAAAAARATGIPANTIKSRILCGKTNAVSRAQTPTSATIVPLALPEPARLRPVPASVSQRRVMVIPDTQCRPGIPLEHLTWAGQYAAAKRPDYIIHLGDHHDMCSLSSYDKGKRSFEGRRYKLDIAAGNLGLDLFMVPVYAEVERSLSTDTPWQPEMHVTLGNHENRITRAAEDAAELHGLISYDDFNWVQHGWLVHPFLDVITVSGIAFSHYFVSGVMGRPVTSARALLTKKHCSAIMGHVQRLESCVDYDARGKRITGLFAGCYTQAIEEYLTPQGNTAAWSGVHMLYGVTDDGQFTQNSVDIDYLRDRFGGK